MEEVNEINPAKQRRDNHLSVLQALIGEFEGDCAGILQARAALQSPTPEAQAAWDAKLADYQARVAVLRDVVSYLMECPVDAAAAHAQFEDLVGSNHDLAAEVEGLKITLAGAERDRDEFKEACAQNLRDVLPEAVKTKEPA